MTKIEWTNETWNPVTGCTKISVGCKNCYAERMAKRLAGRFGYPRDEPFKVTLHPERLEEPLHRRKPRMVFVCSMGDLFHEDVPWEFIVEVFLIMARASHHTYQILTKRPERMREFCSAEQFNAGPFKHLWLGVTAENQKAADERIPILLDTPAAIRFVSCEPLLGTMDLRRFFLAPNGVPPHHAVVRGLHGEGGQGLDWVIAGGETGPGARPMHPDWAHDICNQCIAVAIPFFFKKMGQGLLTPGYLQIREWPQSRRG
ncbi:MAG: phage Gp37/Gp68 family protein [Candidatus Eisenbacteria bacterium]|uniref:Phage Gp37/Gp68 family protein n=1 Tax=Eiseniibacteriota bacterium TaxID=2212470 RepID=A0A948RWP6_UNCEI|nr:phage Gp37/Gp68 family protein [Candidatus Eisenbacteria bacterium]MBU1948145.1 phage Gp37/Gp68 family protein [Candidatus Eisenbacteria bacterium]MBU2691881.1 phage Gp37/Gp68 family protein [Candidatus Eisenbacteria bacterium]